MGKTSVKSRINLPGRVAWFLMEIPGFSILLYVMRTLPGLSGITDLPWQNKVLAGLFVRPQPPLAAEARLSLTRALSLLVLRSFTTPIAQ